MAGEIAGEIAGSSNFGRVHILSDTPENCFDFWVVIMVGARIVLG